MWKEYLVLSLIFICPAVDCYNILILHPPYIGSHVLILRSFGEHLISRGHNVTQVTFKNAHVKLRPSRVNTYELPLIDPDGSCDFFVDNKTQEFNLENGLGKWIIDEGDSVSLKLPPETACLFRIHCSMLLDNEDLMSTLKQLNFDMAIVDLFSNGCGLATATVLDLPVVSFWASSFQAELAEYLAGSGLPSIVPAFATGYPTQMSLLQRMRNVFIYGLHQFHSYRQYSFLQSAISSTSLGKSIPPLSEQLNQIALHLCNISPLLDSARPLHPKEKRIGGPHLREGKPLENPFKDYFSNSKHGVILCNLGLTGMSPRDVPKELINKLMQAFELLKPYNILFKFDPSVIHPQSIPSNVWVQEWIPQQDVLAHEATKLFISHMGMFGFLEAIYHGVPIASIPFFGDQMDNAARAIERGLALPVPGGRRYFTPEGLANTAREAIRDANLLQNIQRYSELLRDEHWPLTPRDQMAHWVELTARFHHFEHLDSSDQELNLLQYLCIDVLAVYLLFFGLFCWLVKRTFGILAHSIHITRRNPKIKSN